MEMASTANLTADANPKLDSMAASATDGKTSPDAQKTAGVPGWETKTFCEKFRYLRNVITVEPIVLCVVLALSIARVTVEVLFIYKACRVNLNYSEDICTQIVLQNKHNYTVQQQEAHKIVTRMNTWKFPLQYAIPLVLILFLGSYSDRHKIRKPFLILPIVAKLLSMCGLVLCVYMDRWPVEVAGILEILFPALVGGSTTFIVAFYAYIAEVSSIETRTFRIGVAHTAAAVAFPVGPLITAALFKYIGYYGIFLMSIALYGVAILYTVVMIKEPKQPIDIGRKNFAMDFFDPQHAVDTFKVIFKNREGNLKVQTLFLIFVFIVTVGPNAGIGSIGIIYTNGKFKWTLSDYSLWISYDTLVGHLIGTTFAITYLSRHLGISDALLGSLSCVARICVDFIYAFANVGYVMYIGSVVGCFVGIGSVAVRSIATKLVNADELGKMQCIFGIVEVIVPIIYIPLYNYVYTQTASTFPGTFFLLGAAMISPAIAIFLWMYVLQKRSISNKVGVEPQLETKEMVHRI